MPLMVACSKRNSRFNKVISSPQGYPEKIADGKDKELSHIARIRLVKLMLATGEYEQGLKVINDVDQAEAAKFSDNYDELVGDLYVALDRLDEARTSYQKALKNGYQSPLLQLKIDDLTRTRKNRSQKIMRFLTALLIALTLTGCSAFDTVGETIDGVKNYFTGGADNTDPPNPLAEYTPEVNPEIIWQESVGAGTDGQTLKLVPAIGSSRIFAADRNGLVQARDLSTGKLAWGS